MYSITFCYPPSNETDHHTVNRIVCCKRYDVVSYNDGAALISVYEDIHPHKDKPGTDFLITNKTSDMPQCYLCFVSLDGKTVDRIRASDNLEEPKED